MSVKASSVTLVGEVEVAEHLTAHHDRHAEERAHRGMVGRKAEAVGMRAKVGQPDRSWFADQEAEDAVALGRLADRGSGVRRRCRR